MLKWYRIGFVCVLLGLGGCISQSTDSGKVGVERKQFLLVPAKQIEKEAAHFYGEEVKKAKKEGRQGDEATLNRLKKIAARLIPHTGIFREDAPNWQWEVNLEDNPAINAYCAPGGKIMFFTGIIRTLQLNEDEIAAIMGHEMAHALREHGRERASESIVQQLGILGAAKIFELNDQKTDLLSKATVLAITLPHSRLHETEADTIGLELIARAGYNPKAAISLWQKMGKQSQGKEPPVFLSTHPSGTQRIEQLQKLLPVVEPLYLMSKKS